MHGGAGLEISVSFATRFLADRLIVNGEIVGGLIQGLAVGDMGFHHFVALLVIFRKGISEKALERRPPRISLGSRNLFYLLLVTQFLHPRYKFLASQEDLTEAGEKAKAESRPLAVF